jgi:hypothetical protein
MPGHRRAQRRGRAQSDDNTNSFLLRCHPFYINFSHDSIMPWFSTGETLYATYFDLQQGLMAFTDFPRIQMSYEAQL